MNFDGIRWISTSRTVLICGFAIGKLFFEKITILGFLVFYGASANKNCPPRRNSPNSVEIHLIIGSKRGQKTPLSRGQSPILTKNSVHVSASCIRIWSHISCSVSGKLFFRASKVSRKHTEFAFLPRFFVDLWPIWLQQKPFLGVFSWHLRVFKLKAESPKLK